MTSNRATGDEFQIIITGTEIRATYRPYKGIAKKAGNTESLPAKDSLAMQTVHLLETWLNVWDRIQVRGVENVDMILGDDTLRIIGRHLWNLILGNSIGNELRQLIAKRKARKLRVLITFVDESPDIQYAVYETLKGLPWEFLCVGEGQSAIFLAAATNLQLARFVELGKNDSGLSFGDAASLRVQFITALPKAGYSEVWIEVQDFRDAVMEIDGIEAPAPVQGLDIEAIREALREEPFHIIHLVGVCKGSPGQPRMLLQSQGKTDWLDPTNLIQALTPENLPRPRLVILHLCEVQQGDASENFERLAPALIARGVPAVLALQYPMDIKPGAGIGVEFYRKLVQGEFIGAAVQSSRHQMLDEKGRRNFGTPVLYLQQDGMLVRHNPNAPTGGTKPAALTEIGAKQPLNSLSGLVSALISPPAEIDRDALRRVWDELNADTDVSPDADTVTSILKILLKAHENDPDLTQAINYLLRVVKSPQRGPEDARASLTTRPARSPAAQFVKA